MRRLALGCPGSECSEYQHPLSIREYLQNEQMMQLAAYVGKKYQYMQKPSTLFLKSGNYPMAKVKYRFVGAR